MEQDFVPRVELPHLQDNTTQYCDQSAQEGSPTLVSQIDDTDIWVGMSFKSAECVKAHYRQYAMKKGFGMKVRNSKKGTDGQIKYNMFACVWEGNYVSSLPNDLKTNPTRKIQCPAKICTSVHKDGLWYINTFNDDHCHDLSPGKSRMFEGNRRISMHVKRTIQINDDAGVRFNKSFRSLVQEAGGHENLPFVERDIRNFVRQERKRLGKDGDGKALREYFSRMQQLNSNFFYEIDLDDDFHVRNVFWADARSRASYEYFGDVISFDTTYLTNKYDMPFAPFVGVNHQGQSILLGCGLLSAEDTESFTWLFRSWLSCMYGKSPQGIVTDQCKAMKKAIQLVFPDARHRWCLWHIMKKIPEKFKSFLEYKSIKCDMKECVYESLTERDSKMHGMLL
ncbi:protein FAR1-RELATED SEQUENCE 5-like [Lotus japonicus]|uniref:protein FAR1-RELATED SEQUENCE 5-like n=1 Tax=Lotus japonicus TaxID=34305 RepID=UPI00258A905B|nr:protein FAR1-RELATED SEQUENCE 5-like [Lotus japonicus]